MQHACGDDITLDFARATANGRWPGLVEGREHVGRAGAQGDIARQLVDGIVGLFGFFLNGCSASDARQAEGERRGAVGKPRTPDRGRPQACSVGGWLVHGGRARQGQAAPVFTAWVEDLERIVDAHRLDRFALFGLSQGESVAVAYAARNPQRVTPLALHGPCVRGLLKRNPSEKAVAAARAMLPAAQAG